MYRVRMSTLSWGLLIHLWPGIGPLYPSYGFLVEAITSLSYPVFPCPFLFAPRRDNPGEPGRPARGRQAAESSGSGDEIGEAQDCRRSRETKTRLPAHVQSGPRISDLELGLEGRGRGLVRETGGTLAEGKDGAGTRDKGRRRQPDRHKNVRVLCLRARLSLSLTTRVPGWYVYSAFNQE